MEYNESVGFLDATQLEQQGTAMNLVGGTTSAMYDNGTIGIGTWYYYLPLPHLPSTR